MANDIFIGMKHTLINVVQWALGSRESRDICVKQENNMKTNLIYVGISVATGIILYIAWSLSNFSVIQILLVNIISAFLFYFVLSFSLFSWTKKRENVVYNLEISQKILAQWTLLIALWNIWALLFSSVGMGLWNIISLASFVLYMIFICKTFSELTTTGVWGIFWRIIAVAIAYGIVLMIIISSLWLTSVLSGTSDFNKEAMYEEIMSNQIEQQKEMFLKMAEADGDMNPEEIQQILDFYDSVGNLSQDELQEGLSDIMKWFETLSGE